MTKRYCDYSALQLRQEKALQRAREILAERGISFPVSDSSLSQEENYARFLAYSEAEANLIVELLKEPLGGERPLVVDNVQPPKLGWDGYK